MQDLSTLRRRIQKVNYQGFPVTNLFFVLKEYWPLGRYMLNVFGYKSWLSFWYTKLFVSDEGGEYAISDYFVHRFFPKLLRIPKKIEIEHTTLCNKKCFFCAHTYWNEKPQRMSFEMFKKIIDDIKSLKWINMAGIGSNYLNKDFLRMVEYARQKHLNVNFVDEFDFINEPIAKRLIEMGVNSIFVSFDAATKETYQKMKKGSDYDRVLDNIRMFLRLKSQMKSPFPVVHFRYLVTKINYHEMPEYIDLIASLENRGPRSRVSFTGLIAYPGIEEHFLPMSQIPEDTVRRTYEKALLHGINLHFSHADVSLPPISSCVRWTEPFILVNGEVIADCAILMQTSRKDLNRKSFGNALEKPFAEIWKSEKYRLFRTMVVNRGAKVPDICSNCCAFDTRTRSASHGIARFMQ